MRNLTVELLKMEARTFAERESTHKEKSLYGVTDGKAVGTYLEHKFQEVLKKRYKFNRSSSAKGIDFPQIGVDIKATGFRQPQSLKILANKGNVDDRCAFMTERFLPVDDIQAHKLAQEILNNPPAVGYLTISNALQWRLQYARAIEQAGKVHGVERIA